MVISKRSAIAIVRLVLRVSASKYRALSLLAVIEVVLACTLRLRPMKPKHTMVIGCQLLKCLEGVRAICGRIPRF